jgi:acetolactate synthase-1/2/3 large subunit
MTGAEYVAEFLHNRQCRYVFTVTGGACAFIVDAIGRHPEIDYICFQHEQAAAMAADAIWRVNKSVGVTVATSGPGATNLITGIACSYFDSIPTIHLTGQVNKSESAAYLGAKVRQAGFQETNIVDIVRPITKRAVQVQNVAELKHELRRAYHIALSGRMGPVLIDVPMNVQKDAAGETVEYSEPLDTASSESNIADIRLTIQEFMRGAERPLVLVGAGIGLAGASDAVMGWLDSQGLPFVSSWSGMSYFNHEHPTYCGHIGVYGNRGANYLLQNSDTLLVLGSRLDNRQRSGNPKQFAPAAKVLVIDIDAEELKKYAADGYCAREFDLRYVSQVLEGCTVLAGSEKWSDYVMRTKLRYLWSPVCDAAELSAGEVSPYAAVQRLNQAMDRDAVVVSDCGANLCWVYQVFKRTGQTLYTAAGNSPMGYALPAAVGAALVADGRQVVCFIGDGGFQMNIQELQTIVHYELPIKIVILNNRGYGIIKQFQDSYFESRYEATGRGYSAPDFGRIAAAYGLDYTKVTDLGQLGASILAGSRARIIDVTLNEHALIQPKIEMGRPINDQFPYVSDEHFAAANEFVDFSRTALQK